MAFTRISGASARPKAEHTRRRARGVVPYLIIAAGLLLACSPLLAELAHRSEVHDQISQVEETWSAADDAKAERAWKQARAYNRSLAGKKAKGTQEILPYEEQLVYGSWTFMCYLQVPSVGIELPVYHGTSEEALSSGAGHLEATSLPVGGKGSNCCISAHSGVATGSMFDGLRDVSEGDLVELRTLGRELFYRVSEVRIVDEDDATPLEISKGRDLLTLITCTSDPLPGMPRGGYGVNNRRLVVVCERCDPPPLSQNGSLGTSMANPLNGRAWPAAVAVGVLAVFLIVRAIRVSRGRPSRAPRGAHSKGNGLGNGRKAGFGYGGNDT